MKKAGLTAIGSGAVLVVDERTWVIGFLRMTQEFFSHESCGQCSLACPVGAIMEEDSTAPVWRAIHDSAKHVIVQVAPSVRAALGDEFGFESGDIVTGQMTTALRTAYEVFTGKTLPRLDFEEVRGFGDIKETTIDLDGTPLKVAVAHTLKKRGKAASKGGRVHLYRGHGLPRRLHRRRTAHRHHQRRPAEAHRCPLQAGPEPAPAEEPRQSGDPGHLPGLLQQAPVPQDP